MRRVLLLFLFIVPFVSSVAGQAKHPFTFENMMKLKRVGEPEVSPDGKWVIFSVVDVDLAANTKTPHVWIVPLGTQGPSTVAKDSQMNPSSSLGMTGEKSGDKKESGVPHVSPNLRDVGGTERELISDQEADRPRWAPDGKRFAFLSTKEGGFQPWDNIKSPSRIEGGSQVWAADFDTATGTVTGVYKLTSITTEASGELWSPDGRSLLFTSDVYPQCDNRDAMLEASCNARKLREAEDSKVKAQVFTHLLYRHWNAYKEGKRTHIFVLRVTEPNLTSDMPMHGLVAMSAPRDVTPGDYDAPVFSLGGQDDYAFSPDGKEICYASNHDKNPAASTNNDLWIVPVSGGPAGSVQAKNITAENPASDTSPLYSPDGRYIAYRAQQRAGYESDRFRLMLYDRKTGEKKDLTPDFEQWVGTLTWSPDSKTIYFASEHMRHSLIYAVGPIDAKVPAIRALVYGYDDDIAVTAGGKKLVFSRMSLQAPTEIYTAEATAEGCPARTGNVDPGYERCSLSKDSALTHINDALLSHIEMSEGEAFSFRGASGDEVEGTIIRPPNFDASKKYPVKFLIHGGPQGAWGDDWSYRWNPELFASPTSSTPSGYVVIMINFHGSTGYGQKFIDAINGDWGGAPFEDLMKGLDYAEQTYPFIDKNRECALGASYGGYMANWILGHTDRFKCIVTHDGMFNAVSAWGATEELWFNDWEFKGTPYTNREMYRKWSPHEYATNFKTPTLVIHGQRDYRLDVSQGFDLFTTLQMQGVPSEMLYFPDEGHWVLKPQNSQLWYKTVNDWVDRWIGK